MRLVISAVNLGNKGFNVKQFKLDKRTGDFILEVQGTEEIPCPPLADGFCDWMRDKGWERETDILSDLVVDNLLELQLKDALFK